jgi:hypothetical protein
VSLGRQGCPPTKKLLTIGTATWLAVAVPVLDAFSKSLLFRYLTPRPTTVSKRWQRVAVAGPSTLTVWQLAVLSGCRRAPPRSREVSVYAAVAAAQAQAGCHPTVRKPTRAQDQMRPHGTSRADRCLRTDPSALRLFEYPVHTNLTRLDLPTVPTHRASGSPPSILATRLATGTIQYTQSVGSSYHG